MSGSSTMAGSNSMAGSESGGAGGTSGGAGGSAGSGGGVGTGCTGKAICWDFEDGKVPEGFTPYRNQPSGELLVDDTKAYGDSKYALHAKDIQGQQPQKSLTYKLPANWGPMLWGRMHVFTTPTRPASHAGLFGAYYLPVGSSDMTMTKLDWFEVASFEESYMGIWHPPWPPGYPEAVLTVLRDHDVLSPSSVVADIGSGTGLLTELFLRNGNRVYAVEPNDAMRAAGERLLAGYPNFHSVAGTAEATTLPHESVDLVAAGQAFHWFDRPKTRHEFARFLRPDGWVVLVWNERETETSDFLRVYEQLLVRYSTDYTQIDHRQIGDKILSEFYGPGGYQSVTMSNRQDFDFVGLKGRLLSSSYAPQAGHPDHEAMLAELARVFDAHQSAGQIAIEYTTKLYFGRLS